jgi:hypothetical protein
MDAAASIVDMASAEIFFSHFFAIFVTPFPNKLSTLVLSGFCAVDPAPTPLCFLFAKGLASLHILCNPNMFDFSPKLEQKIEARAIFFQAT